jgi:hypothetical protein
MHSLGNIQSPEKKGRWIFFLLIGVLSMLYAELFSGASHIWYLDAWSLLVTFPLYLVHVLFFLNLAFLSGKTSLVHLYLWGTLFGLYESWITQVLWIGYGVQGLLAGTVLGIGIGEFLALVFFWHPILSFILPICIFQILSISVSQSGDRIMTSHLPFLLKRNHTWEILLGLYVTGSLFMAVNYQGNLLMALGALGGTYAILYVLYWRAWKAYPDSFSIYSLRVGSTGMKILFLIMVMLYLGMFVGFGYVNDRVPGILPIVTTILLYAVFGLIIFFSQKSGEPRTVPIDLMNARLTLSDYRNLAFFNITLTVIFCSGFSLHPQILFGLFLLFYFAICITGMYIFLKVLFLRNKQSRAYFEARIEDLQEEMKSSL